MTDETEHIERTDVGVSIEVQIKRGSGTRDEDKLKAKTKAETLDEARGDMDELKPWLRAFAEDVREWQPAEEPDDE